MPGTAFVSIRPLQRSDLDGFGAWGTHSDPLLLHYNVRALCPAAAQAMWQSIQAQAPRRRMFAALEGGVFAGTLLVRSRGAGVGEVGIVLDPRRIGRGLGRRILSAFVAVLGSDGYRRLQLDVAAYNERAIAAYRAAGFVAARERWQKPEAGMDIAGLLAGPSAAVLATHVQAGSGGYRVRVIRMERGTIT